MQSEPSMNLNLFYRGLLYALREQREGFVADGEAFHRAFREMLEVARDNAAPIPAQELLEEFDPIFGVSPHATEMVFDGERDFILSLMNPRLVTATFKISEEDAREALNRLDAAETFRALAADLHARLSPT
jgi:hypothetical protein